MVDFRGFPIAKIVLAVFWLVVVFVLFNSTIHYSLIDSVEACNGIGNDAVIQSCQNQVKACLELPLEQQNTCFTQMQANSGLVLSLEARLAIFLLGLVLIAFGDKIFEGLQKDDSLARDVPKEPDQILKAKIISQLATPLNNYLKNVEIEFQILKRNRAGAAHLKGTGLAGIDDGWCQIDPRKGVEEPVKSVLMPLKWFISVYGRDTAYGKRVASIEDISDVHLPVKREEGFFEPKPFIPLQQEQGVKPNA